MQPDNNKSNGKSNGKSHLQQSLFTKSLAGVLILGGLATGANRVKTIPSVLPEQTVVRHSVQPRTAASVTQAVLLQTQDEPLKNVHLAGVEQSASFVLAVKR